VSIEPDVTLRLLRHSDWRAVHAWTIDPEVCRYQPWDPKSEEETRQYVRQVIAEMDRRPQSRWVYAVEHHHEVVGTCELNLRSEYQAEIACVIRTDRWGRGVATAATRRLIALAFTDHQLHRVFATCDPRNVPSAAVLKRIGMQHEGRLRETVLLRDGWRDSDLFSLLVGEWTRGTTPAPE
jgi:ribosomal-protein-alanine N-acetyltransferase